MVGCAYIASPESTKLYETVEFLGQILSMPEFARLSAVLCRLKSAKHGGQSAFLFPNISKANSRLSIYDKAWSHENKRIP